MSVSENQIVVYQPNETVRLDVRLQKCCQCVNVLNTQIQFPMKWGAFGVGGKKEVESWLI